MVDEEAGADGRAGVDVDTGAAVGVFGHDPRDERRIPQIKFMGEPVGGDGCHARVAEYDLVMALGRGIPVVGRFHVAHEQLSDPGDRLQEFEGDPVGDFLAGRRILLPARGVVHQASGDFLPQPDIDGVHQPVDEKGHVLRHERFVPEIPRETKDQQVSQDAVNPFPRRQVISIFAVQAADRVVGLYDLGCQRAEMAARLRHGEVADWHHLLTGGLIAPGTFHDAPHRFSDSGSWTGQNRRRAASSRPFRRCLNFEEPSR